MLGPLGIDEVLKQRKQKNTNLTEKDLEDIKKEEALNNFIIQSDKYRQITDKKGNTVIQKREKAGQGPDKIKVNSLDGTNKEISKQIKDKLEKETKKNKKQNRGTQLVTEKLKRTYRDRGGVLRYPFEALTERTDYLQIDINQYESARQRSGNENNLIGRVGTRRLSTRGRNPFGLTTKSLVNKGTILLQIPSQVQDGNSVSYGDSKMNTIVGAALQGTTDVTTAIADGLTQPGGGGIFDRIEEAGDGALGAMGKALEASNVDVNTARQLFNAKIATGVVGAFGGNVSVNQLLARQSGQIFNPNMELLFNGPTLRNFRFSFKMTPRSPEEAEQCKLIIRTFKMNMAPKVTNGRGEQSLFLNTPNVFELRYKSGAANHPFLHRFKQCFLTDISVNYTGEGVYATYENREPVSMIMDLTFKELEPIYDQDYFDDIGRDADSTVGF
tara:strand:+ start:839 stop:2167 length:1329 start_codon:yes stop_codon:yes gene_type:complete